MVVTGSGMLGVSRSGEIAAGGMGWGGGSLNSWLQVANRLGFSNLGNAAARSQVDCKLLSGEQSPGGGYSFGVTSAAIDTSSDGVALATPRMLLASAILLAREGGLVSARMCWNL